MLNDPAGCVTQGSGGVPVAIPAQLNRHVMTQCPDGVPVVLPEQASGGGVPLSVAVSSFLSSV